jgi:hypothetical protein
MSEPEQPTSDVIPEQHEQQPIGMLFKSSKTVFLSTNKIADAKICGSETSEADVQPVVEHVSAENPEPIVEKVEHVAESTSHEQQQGAQDDAAPAAMMDEATMQALLFAAQQQQLLLQQQFYEQQQQSEQNSGASEHVNYDSAALVQQQSTSHHEQEPLQQQPPSESGSEFAVPPTSANPIQQTNFSEQQEHVDQMNIDESSSGGGSKGGSLAPLPYTGTSGPARGPERSYREEPYPTRGPRGPRRDPIEALRDTKTLYIAGFPVDAPDEELVQFFREFNVKGVRVPRYDDSGKGKGYIFEPLEPVVLRAGPLLFLLLGTGMLLQIFIHLKMPRRLGRLAPVSC